MSIQISGRFLLFLFFLTGIFYEAPGQNKSSVKVTATGFKNNKGQAVLAIFKTSDGFPSDFAKAFKKYTTIIHGNKAAFDVELTEDIYALVCVHDENKNDKMDKNIIGIPKEGVGLSNYIEKGFPSFNKAKISINDKVSSLAIIIHYL
jgi:uncharacterized protein (DUF2141 family)